MNIVFFQNGNYAEAYLRFEKGGAETYRDQRASVSKVAQMAQEHSVTVIAVRDDAHDIRLTPNLRSLGVPRADITPAWLADMFDATSPDRVICRSPDWRVLRATKARGIKTLPYFADMFRTKSLRSLYRNLRLRQTLQGDHIPCVCNHSRNASRSLQKALFLPKTRILPWDRRVIETGLAPKHAPASAADPAAPLTLFYAGSLSEAKGVTDILAALKELREGGLTAQLSIASRADPAPWQDRAKAHGVLDQVTFLGTLSNDAVLEAMRAHDVVLVPTRHDYPEGLPNTLREALAVRTPLVISDHPAFRGRLVHERDCLIFPAGDIQSLTREIRRLAEDGPLYGALSERSEQALEGLPYGLYWDVLLDNFLAEPEPGADWVRNNTLAALENNAGATR